MAELFNIKTQKMEPVADENALQLLESRQYNLPSEIVKDGNVGMVAPDGTIYEVPLADVRGAMGDQYRLETIGERKQRNARITVENMGPLSYPAAAGIGVAQALLPGISSLALTESGLVKPETLGAIGDKHPYVEGGLTLGTVLAASYLSGGAYPLLRGATAPLRGAMALTHGAGKAAGGVASRIVGQRTAGKLVEKSVQYGVEGALDSALFAGGNYLNEVAKERTEFNGQALLSHMSSEAKTGLLFGAGTGVLAVPGRAAMEWGKANSKLLAKVLPTGADTRQWDKIRQSPDPLKALLEDQAGAQALQSLGMRQAHFRELMEKGGKDVDSRYDDAKKWLFEHDIIPGSTSLEDAQRKIHQLAEESGDEIQRFYSEIDRLHKAGDDTRPVAWVGMRWDDFVDSIEEVHNGLDRATEVAFKKEIKAKLDYTKDMAMDATGIPRWVPDIAPDGTRRLDANGDPLNRNRDYDLDYKPLTDVNKPELSLQEAVRHKNGYDEKANFSALDPDFKKREYRRIYGKLNAKIYEAAERTSREVHGGLVDSYNRNPFVYNGKVVQADNYMEAWLKNKKNFGIADDLRDMMRIGVAAEASNRKVSLTDYIAGSAGLSYFGEMLGPGGALVAPALGAGVALGHRYVKKYGHSMAAGKLARLARLESIHTGAANRLRESAVDFVSGPVKRSFMPGATNIIQQTFGDVEGIENPTRSDYARHAANQLAELVSNPEMLAGKVAPMVEDLEELSPELAAAVTRGQMRKVEFLHEKAKELQSPVQFNALQPHLYADMPIDPSKLASFERTLEAAGDFVGTFERELAAGAVSAETIETGGRLYDRLLDQARIDIQAELGSRKGAVAQYDSAALSTVFGGGVLATRGRDFQARQSLVWAVKEDENRMRSMSLSGVKRAPSGKKKSRVELLTQTPAASMQERLG